MCVYVIRAMCGPGDTYCITGSTAEVQLSTCCHETTHMCSEIKIKLSQLVIQPVSTEYQFTKAEMTTELSGSNMNKLQASKPEILLQDGL